MIVAKVVPASIRLTTRVRAYSAPGPPGQRFRRCPGGPSTTNGTELGRDKVVHNSIAKTAPPDQRRPPTVEAEAPHQLARATTVPRVRSPTPGPQMSAQHTIRAFVSQDAASRRTAPTSGCSRRLAGDGGDQSLETSHGAPGRIRTCATASGGQRRRSVLIANAPECGEGAVARVWEGAEVLLCR
jgi:hypothetical protein